MCAVAIPVTGVGGARPGSDEHHSGFARGPGIAVGHVGGALLVTDEDVLDVVLLVDLVVDMQDRAPRVAEDVLHPFVLEELHEYLRP